MTISLGLLILVVAGALVFEYINGFHDAANAIATVVSTKVLTPRQAVVYGASLEFTGALMGTHVAKTIGAGIVNPDTGCCDYLEPHYVVFRLALELVACSYRRFNRFCGGKCGLGLRSFC